MAENIEGSQANKFYITNCNAMDKESVEANFTAYQCSAQFLIMHPPIWILLSLQIILMIFLNVIISMNLYENLRLFVKIV